MLHSYPTIYNLGDKLLDELFNGPVLVEEKIDGSQFSFGLSDDGELQLRSKGSPILPDAPPKMFQGAVDYVKSVCPLLIPGWTYRCEWLSKPNHNVLVYDRTPKHGLILFDVDTFDVDTGLEKYMTANSKAEAANMLDLECVPVLYEGMVKDVQEFRVLLETQSLLGGQTVEGVVVKPLGYDLFGPDHEVVMGKFVSEKLKEVHSHEWTKEHRPVQADLVGELVLKYQTAARWGKAVQHLRDQGGLEESPRDIPNLIKEVQRDVIAECQQEIKDFLFSRIRQRFLAGVIRGLPEWWKEQLLDRQFTELGWEKETTDVAT